MSISRRNFLQGTAACAVVAALPAVAVDADNGVAIAQRYFAGGPIFEESIGTYQGVIIRDVRRVYDPQSLARQSLKSWMGNRSTSAVMHPDLVTEAKRLARTCPPQIRPWGVMTSTVLEGVECDGC